MWWLDGEPWNEKKQRLEQWHSWFAWHPVCVGKVWDENRRRFRKRIVWLETIERRGEFWMCMYGEGWGWYYRVNNTEPRS